MGKRYITWAEENEISTGYNQSVTKDRLDNVTRKKENNFPVDVCPECGRAFETGMSNGKGNGRNRLLRPRYLASWYPTLSLKRSLCGGDKCHNKKLSVNETVKWQHQQIH